MSRPRIAVVLDEQESAVAKRGVEATRLSDQLHGGVAPVARGGLQLAGQPQVAKGPIIRDAMRSGPYITNKIA